MSNLKGFQQENKPKKPRALVITASLLEINITASIRAMPLAVSNGLPAAEFWLGYSNETEVLWRFHIDSCASMHTGNLFVNQWLMKKYLEIFHRHGKFDDSNTFEPIMLEIELIVDSEK